MPSLSNDILTSLHRGMSFGFMARRGYFASHGGLAEIDHMADLGVTSVALMVTVMQDTWHATRVYQDFEFTPADHEIEIAISRFHARGIRVMLKPMIECRDGAWRGRINFPDGDQLIQGREIAFWPTWFESLSQSVVHYGRLADRTGCEAYCIGCELLGAEQAINNAHWERIITASRAVYSGMVCYDAMPETLHLPDGPPAWLRQLDAVCVSYYSPASDQPGASTASMIEKLAATVSPLRRISERLDGLPIIFGEAGCRSVHGGAMHPAEYRNAGAYAPEEQARFLDAMCSVFWEESWWLGFYWWKWEEQQPRPQYRVDPAGDTGFTLAGKPAAEVLRRWLHRPAAARDFSPSNHSSLLQSV